MNDNKISFIVYGAFFSIMPIIYLVNSIMTQTSPPLLTFYSLIIIAVTSFCFSYLAPNFSKNDQEAKRSIIRKGIITGFVVLVISIAIALTLIGLNLFNVHPFHLAMILFTILVTSGFIATVAYTKNSLRHQ